MFSSNRNKCKKCRSEITKEWAIANPEKVQAAKPKRLFTATEWQRKNRTLVNVRSKQRYSCHPEKSIKATREWQKRNPAKHNANSAKGRAHKFQATPSWADLPAIKDVYLEAAYMQMTVDHIVPLRNKLVCGLHVWDNLQLLTKSKNSSKGNRHWPDM